MDTQKPHQDQEQETNSSETAMNAADQKPQQVPKKSKPKVWIIALILVVVVAAGVGGWLVYTQSRNNKKVTTQQQADVGSNFQTAEVSITATGFNPATIKIKKGDQVMWKNTDSNPHRVFAEPYPTKSSLPDLDSGSLAPGTSYGFIFEQTGTFKYTDYNNPTKFLGTIIVE